MEAIILLAIFAAFSWISKMLKNLTTANMPSGDSGQRPPNFIEDTIEKQLHSATKCSIAPKSGELPLLSNNQEKIPNQPAWQLSMDANSLMQGIILAEILQPPRAYRQIGPNRGNYSNLPKR